MKSINPLFTIFFILLFLGSCKSEKEKPSHKYLGVVNITISGNESAKPFFEQGLLLLHSFEYEDAREAFFKAQKADPLMPMAYWGEAMTYNHSIWHDQDYDEGVAALAPLTNIDIEKKSTELEQDFIKAVQLLYQPKKEKLERDIAYANYLKKMVVKYPSNHEVAAFYALSLLGAVPEGRDDIEYEKGAKIANGILKENSNHPGALHYLIHSYDDPKHAALALDAAYSYSRVAPDASHALHMPSHIFVALGMWDEVISSNINSYQASINRMNRKKLDNSARGYHAYHWLEYGYLQKENFEEAATLLKNMQIYAEETPTKRARTHLVYLKGTYLVNSNHWESDYADIKVDISDLNVSQRSQYQFLEGMKAYKKGNKTQVDRIIKILDNDINRETFIVSNEKATFCSGSSRGVATKSDLVECQIRQNQLQALSASLDKNTVLAETHFLTTLELTKTISYSYGPPVIQKPVNELYADWLVSQDRKKEAKAQYEITLTMAPKRLLSLKGVEQTL
ncbi:hypothetical protein ABXT64_00995 [Candidatus Marifrigoribacter sp. Uisw_064]|uniref:hypothetical protein n=1 Tax=Candidatus Marifrigoribacter sp. Uisw_064 TaxID=3230970 RepID=UPI003D399AA5